MQEVNVINLVEEKEIDSLVINSDTIFYDRIFSNNIKTVLLHPYQNELDLPIITWNSNEKMVLSFDDLDANVKDYSYTFMHCNFNWKKSDLMKSEYLNAIYKKPITEYEFSFNTIQEYTHYHVNFPEEDFKPLISGNYILKVFLEGELIITKRFMVLEKKLNIDAEVRKATLVSDRKIKHEVDFTINHPELRIIDPFSEIKVVVRQNNREDNSIIDLQPLFVKNNELIYDYQQENTFLGNNEFRHFDIRSLRFQSDRIKNISFDSLSNHVLLFPDYKKTFDNYSINPDINGKFIIKSQEAWNSSVEADYAWVHFTLPIDKVISYGEIYVFGEFSAWQISKDFKLNYNYTSQQYEKSVFLKQGYYNYCYALNDTLVNRLDLSFIEGTHYETRNDYYIYVYHREVGSRYDKLVGFLKTSSKNLF